MKLTIVSFSGRENGNCAKIARLLQEKLTEHNVTVHDFSSLSLSPCGRCHCECFQDRTRCPYFADPAYAIYDAVTHSDLAIYILPNYSDFPCANFFAFNERGQCYFQHHPQLERQYLGVRKKFVVVSNTGKENFLAVLRDHVDGGAPDILFLAAKRYGKISIKGDLMDAAQARSDLIDFLTL